MMFDMLQRCLLDKKSGIVKYVKNQIGEPLDKEVKVGKPMDEKWLKAHTTIFNSLGGVRLSVMMQNTSNTSSVSTR